MYRNNFLKRFLFFFSDKKILWLIVLCRSKHKVSAMLAKRFVSAKTQGAD